MKTTLVLLVMMLISQLGLAQFAPPAGEVGTTAIHKDSSSIIDWAAQVESFERGPEDITDPDGSLASFGTPEEALFEAEGNSTNVVSLGDGGSITLSFNFSIRNEEGFDFVVFENSFSDDYLEFAHVEVSSDGERFVRIPSISNIPVEEQTGTYENTDPTLVHNLAGKYRQAYGTPFDLEDIADSTGIDLNDVKFVRIVDVVGSIDPVYGTRDSEGNLINDPYKTDFESGGFDLDGVGVIHNNNPSLSHTEFEVNLSVFPNPTNDFITVSSSEKIRSITLIDMSGKMICLSYSANMPIGLKELGCQSGLHVLKIEMENGLVIHKRLILQ